MGKLTKRINDFLNQFNLLYTSKLSKSLSSYITDANKMNALKDIINDLLNGTLDSNITNYTYTNHPIYGNAWHCHIQSDFILVYEWNANGELVLVDVTNHNDQ